MAIAEKTGWSKESILKMSLTELTIMISDAPKIKKNKKEPRQFTDDEELANWFGVTIENE